MLKFARANLEHRARACSGWMQRTHVSRVSAGAPGMSIGMNWIIRRVSDQQDVVWHNGGTGGYRTWLGFDPKKRLAAVVLTNSAHGADDLGYELLK